MAISSDVRGQLALRLEVLSPHLNERQRRLLLGAEARLLGHGGVRAVAQVAGVSETTVRAGVFELEEGRDPFPEGRARRQGGGRRSAEGLDGGLVAALLALVEPDERGDPQSPLRWTTKSLRHLAGELTRQGHPVSAPTVGRLLRAAGFSLQANAKTLEGGQHPDRDAQFRYINEQVKDHRAGGEPVISVDTKKREQLGRLPMAGREWRPKGQPVEVEDHSFFFTGPEVEQAIPYGIYDIIRDSGWVNVGTDHDTSVFAVESIRRWWRARGQEDYPGAARLLITADAGGSNSYRYRVWKSELAALAAETGLVITVCHFPPGTSKWNKIEHRLFSHITMNWRGRPLTSHEVVVQTIAATRTSRGLRVGAVLDPGDYPTGVAVSKERFAALPLQRHATHGAWNYTLHPAAGSPSVSEGTAGERSSPARRRQQMLAKLNDERLTGMTSTGLACLGAALAPRQAARAQQRHSQQRGGRARRASGKIRGSKPLFDDPARVLLTLLYQRQACSMNVLADLLEVTATCIGDLVGETREVLEDHGYATGTAAVRFPTAQALREFLDSDARPQRAQIIEQLFHPALTGLSRPRLQDLTRRLAPLQAAQAERLGYQRRGGLRQPTARGGVFHQKISNGERVLLAVLYQRHLCTMDVLASLLGVCRSSVGNAIRETLPLLDQAGHVPTPATARYRTGSDLLAAAASTPDPTSHDTAS
jgi:Rhodopirellula transposase DDE domain